MQLPESVLVKKQVKKKIMKKYSKKIMLITK